MRVIDFITVKAAKNILIVHDGHEALGVVARRIESMLKGMHVVVMDAADFAATDLLPADAYFFGYTGLRPASYIELERVLRGINLAGRLCGLFSLASPDAIEYLRGIIRDAELQANPLPFFADAGGDMTAWIQSTLRRS